MKKGDAVMPDYIEIAHYISSTDFIYESTLITEFVQACGIIDIKRIDMEFLRNYHRGDKEKCINLIDELALRGFTFHTERPTNMLPSRVYEIDNTCIFVKEKGERFKDINFSRLGLANFVQRFNVKTDYFFQYIKLDNFLHINDGISLENLKEEFLKCGFDFVNKDELPFKNIDDNDNSNNNNNNNDNNDNDNESTKNIMQKFLEKMALNPTLSGVKITNLFSENGFNVFRNFSEENGILYAEQLEGFPFDELITFRGFGQFKINIVRKRYEDFVNNNFATVRSSENSQELSDIGINSCYLDVELEGLKAIGIDEALIEEFKNVGLRLIGDLLKLDYNELTKIRYVGKGKLNKFMTNIKLLSQPPEELMKYVLKTIKENKNFAIFRARSTGKITLQILGEQYNVTRENIRQKEKKILVLFEGFFMLFKNEIFGTGDKAILNMDEIRNIFTDDEDMLYIKYALISKTYVAIVYFKELDKFLINQNIEEIKAKLDSLIDENLEDIFNFYNDIVYIDEMLKEANLDFIDIEDFLVYAKGKGFKEYGNYQIRGAIFSKKIYCYILRKYFPQGLRYSDQKDLEEVFRIAREDFNIEIHTEEDIRALSGIIGENILYDRGMRIHPDYIDIPAALIEKIKNYILEHSEETLLMGDVFHRFEEELKKQSNVNNRYFLHGVLKHYYGDEFVFARDKISKSLGKILSTNKILENYLMEQGDIVTKEKVRAQFPGWTEVMFQSAEIVNRNIINWDNGRMTCGELLDITQEDKEILQNAIEDALTEHNDYCNGNVIYKRLQLKMNSFYKKNKITRYANLFYVLEYLFQDSYYFRMPHILREKQDKQFTIFDIIIKTIEDRQVVTYEEIHDYFIKKLKMNESTMHAASRKFMSRLIEVRKGEYILKNTLSVDEHSLNMIRSFIETQLSGKEHVSMLSIIDYRGLPDIGYDWNPFLLQDIIEDYIPEYKFLERELKDRRYRCSSIVRSSSALNSIVDLIIYVLENEYKDKENMTVQAIQQYLALRSIVLNILPYEFLSSERVSIDEFHRVEIK
jgi:hypothetical protein